MATTKTAKKATAKMATSKKATAKKASSTTRTTTRTSPRLLEREPKALLEDAGYAAAGVAHDAVDFARTLPTRLDGLRSDAEKAAKEAPERVKDLRTEVPSRVESTVKDVRVRVSKDLQTWLDTFEKRFDTKVADGRKVADSVRSDDRVKRVLEQTDNTRSQVKGAITSVVKTGSVAGEAGREQAATAASQVKAATTSARKTAETVAEAATDESESGESTSSGTKTSGTTTSTQG